MDQPGVAWTVGVIVVLVLLVYGAGVAITLLLRLPWDISLPYAIRLLGIAFIVAGAAILAWFFKYRDMRDVVESTRATWLKLLRRARIGERLDRREPLVVVGPYRIVRHPMYTAISAMALGISLAVDHTFALIGAVFLFLWFALVMAPFEERELKALFGPAYEDYMRTTPRILPIPWRWLRRG